MKTLEPALSGGVHTERAEWDQAAARRRTRPIRAGGGIVANAGWPCSKEGGSGSALPGNLARIFLHKEFGTMQQSWLWKLSASLRVCSRGDATLKRRI